MRLFIAFASLVVATLVLAQPARAACPGYAASEAVRDAVVDAKVHSTKLTGPKAVAAIVRLKSGIASAESCVNSGSTADRAAALAVAAQLRWNEACVLTYDGVPADSAMAKIVAKTSDQEMQSFEATHSSLSGDAQALFGNWEHFDDDIISGHPDSCVQ